MSGTILKTNGKIWTLGGKVLTNIYPPNYPGEITIGTQTWKRTYLDVEPSDTTSWYKDQNTGIHYYKLTEINNSVVPLIQEGWHLPSYNEFSTLFNYVRNNYGDPFYAFASTSGWNYVNGNDTCGLTIEPTGEGRSSEYLTIEPTGEGRSSEYPPTISRIGEYGLIVGEVHETYMSEHAAVLFISKDSKYIPSTYYYLDRNAGYLEYWLPIRLIKDS